MSDALARIQRAIQDNVSFKTSDIISLVENTPEGVTVVCDEDDSGKLYTITVGKNHYIHFKAQD